MKIKVLFTLDDNSVALIKGLMCRLIFLSYTLSLEIKVLTFCKLSGMTDEDTGNKVQDSFVYVE